MTVAAFAAAGIACGFCLHFVVEGVGSLYELISDVVRNV